MLMDFNNKNGWDKLLEETVMDGCNYVRCALKRSWRIIYVICLTIFLVMKIHSLKDMNDALQNCLT